MHITACKKMIYTHMYVSVIKGTFAGGKDKHNNLR